MFCYPWGWVILFYNRNWSSYFYRTDNRVNSFQLQKDKTLFDSCLKLKSPNGWACTIELPISYIVKSVWKPKRLTEWASSPRAHVSEMRNNNPFFFQRAGLQENRIANLCLRAIFFSTKHVFMELGLLAYWLRGRVPCKTHLSLFVDRSLFHAKQGCGRPSAKGLLSILFLEFN